MNKIRIGLIGFGFIGKTHYESIKKMDNAVVHSIFHTPLEEIDVPNEIKLFDNWKNLLDDPEVDAVIIGTPTFTHLGIVKYALEKNKKIFLEKPMTRTVEDCKKIIKLESEKHGFVYMGHVLRFWPSYLSLNRILKEQPGIIGKITELKFWRLSEFPQWSKWFADFSKSGGVIMDLSIHDLDFACYLLGKYPKSISAEIETLEIYGMKIPGRATTKLKFDGVTATCKTSWMEKEFTAKAQIIGDKGIIELDGGSAELKITKNNQIETKIYDDIKDADGYELLMKDFVNCIINNKKPTIASLDGMKAVEIAIKASEHWKKD